MKTYQKFIAVMALSGVCLAASGPAERVEPARKHKKKHAAAEVQQQRCEACEAIDQLKEQIKAQQAQIEAQQSRIETQQSQIDQLKTVQAPPTVDEQARAQAAAAKQAADQAAAAAAAAQTNAGQAQQAASAATAQVAENTKQVGELQHPNYLHYKNIQFIPGGFIALDSVWRQHAEQTDVLSNSFAKIPAPGSSTYDLSEWRATARQSRLSFKAIGNVGDAKLLGYYEMDFLGAAPTANENQSNSFNIRQRQLYADVEWHGWGFAGGQMWTLNNLTKKGVAPYDFWNPDTIDAQYVAGFTFARQAGFRVYKQFDGGKAGVAFSLENNAYLVSGTNPTGAIFSGTGNASFGNGNTYTDNVAPDLIAKVAFDPSFGHFELRGIGRFFRDQPSPLSTNKDTTMGWGVGGGAIVPVFNKKVNLIASALAGSGVARYGDSGVVDVTFRPDGTFATVDNLQALGGIELNPTKKLKFYGYAGDEYWDRTFTYAAQRNVIQGVGGLWYTLYNGGYGRMIAGAQYSYTSLANWNGSKAVENMAFTSLRYFIP